MTLSPAMKCSCHFAVPTGCLVDFVPSNNSHVKTHGQPVQVRCPVPQLVSEPSDLVTLSPGSVSVSNSEDNVTNASRASTFNSNCSLSLLCDPVSIPVPFDDDEFDQIKPVETSYPPIFYELAPETCTLNLLSPVDVCVIASTCLASHDCW